MDDAPVWVVDSATPTSGCRGCCHPSTPRDSGGGLLHRSWPDILSSATGVVMTIRHTPHQLRGTARVKPCRRRWAPVRLVPGALAPSGVVSPPEQSFRRSSRHPMDLAERRAGARRPVPAAVADCMALGTTVRASGSRIRRSSTGTAAAGGRPAVGPCQAGGEHGSPDSRILVPSRPDSTAKGWRVPSNSSACGRSGPSPRRNRDPERFVIH